MSRPLVASAYKRWVLPAKRRDEARSKSVGLIQAIRSELYDKQLAVVDDPSREKAELCTRRAGKTTKHPHHSLIDNLSRDYSLVRIWGITRLRAKELVWENLKALCARHGLAEGVDVKFNDTELRLRWLTRNAEVRLVGADKDKEVQKKRGDKTTLEIVTEAQLFGAYLKTLVEDVVEPSLFDTRGTMLLEGTPGVVCAGHWYEMTGEKQHEGAARWVSGGKAPGWSCHRYSVLDNPFVPHAREELAKLKAKRSWGEDNPTYQREYLARWVNDVGALFYRFDRSRNSYRMGKGEGEVWPFGPGWRHVMGWDLGLTDAMALVAWGYHPRRRGLYEAFSWSKSGALTDDVVDVICEFIARPGVDLEAILLDTGGLGALIAKEVQRRHARLRLPIEAAKKTEKYAHVTLFNDDLLTGNVHLCEGGAYADELATLPRDLDSDPAKAPKEDPRYPNHLADAGLYAWRRAYHWLHEKEETKPPKGTNAAAEAEEAAMEDELERQESERKRANWWEM